ncbi:MAG: NusG domain II-containing protein [Chromatiales bacterium]|nr:NusG domain II-containing protein [Chromatiales bacterium]
MKRGDYFIVLGALIALPWLYLTYWSGSAPGTQALIVDGSGHELTLALTMDRQVEIAGPLGASVIEIHDGKARFVSSPCTGKLCIHAGWLSASGTVAACLPNRVSLTITGHHARWDSINF